MLDPTQLRRFAHQCRTDAVEYRELASTVLRRDTRERLLMSAAIREDDAEFYETHFGPLPDQPEQRKAV